MNYDEAVTFIENVPRFKTEDGRNKSGNDNLLQVLALLDNPQNKVAAIHIAGTNGKGSVACYTRCILEEMGYRVGVFTSPHLIRINERIKACGEDISDEDFLMCFNQVMEAVDKVREAGGTHLSFFEMVFAIAALYFTTRELDYVVYETGLGGRLDATNVITPVVCAITSIGLDHMSYLGNTIQQIAYEKAGIIKESVPVIYNTGDKIADDVIEKQAAKLNSPAYNVAKININVSEITDKTIDFSLCGGYYSYHNIMLNTCGAMYQLDNAATAITLSNCIFCDGAIPEQIIKSAVAKFYWPGRMERLDEYVVVDGAHNEDAIERFVQAVNSIEQDVVNILFAVSSDKDYEPMIKYMCQNLNLGHVYVTSLDTDRAKDAAEIADIFKKYNNRDMMISYDNDIKSALCKSYIEAKATKTILFCVGSLYLVGSVKTLLTEVLDND